jgi:hypothetical protein
VTHAINFTSSIKAFAYAKFLTAEFVRREPQSARNATVAISYPQAVLVASLFVCQNVCLVTVQIHAQPVSVTITTQLLPSEIHVL